MDSIEWELNVVRFYPLMFNCSCMKSSKTVSDECLFMLLDPPVK